MNQKSRCDGEVACSFLKWEAGLCSHSNYYIARKRCGMLAHET